MQPVDEAMLLNRRMTRESSGLGDSEASGDMAISSFPTSSSEEWDDHDHAGKKEGRGSAGGPWRDLQGDYINISILLLLYTLQGIPMGLGASIPLLLQVDPEDTNTMVYPPFGLAELGSLLAEVWNACSFMVCPSRCCGLALRIAIVLPSTAIQ